MLTRLLSDFSWKKCCCSNRYKTDWRQGEIGDCVLTMLPPFVVFDGTKITTAKQPERTLAYKHRNWRNSKPGGTGRMTFQKKHWFDADITIMWFEGDIVSRQGAATQRRNRPYFLSRFSRFLAFWGSSHFGHSNRFFVVFLLEICQNPIFICKRRAMSFYLCTYYLIEENTLGYYRM